MQAAFHVMLMKNVTVDGPFDWLRLGVLPGAFTDSSGMHPSARQISRRKAPGNDSPTSRYSSFHLGMTGFDSARLASEAVLSVIAQ
jgi:hypothetical protein